MEITEIPPLSLEGEKIRRELLNKNRYLYYDNNGIAHTIYVDDEIINDFKAFVTDDTFKFNNIMALKRLLLTIHSGFMKMGNAWTTSI